MPFALNVDKLDREGKISVRHIFYGATQEECEQLRDAHGAGCQAFGPALNEGRIIEEFEEIDELPQWRPDNDREKTWM